MPNTLMTHAEQDAFFADLARQANSITLPWPPRELSPNARVHWRKRGKAAKAYRHACWALVKQSGIAAPACAGRLHLWIDFYPPDRRHRDDDNMIAAFKAGRDGIADALGVNDRRFVCHPYVKDQIGGMVKVRITAGPEQTIESQRETETA